MRVVVPVAAVAAFTLFTAQPAFAAGADTDTTFTITGGALTVSAPTAADLGTQTAGITALQVTGSLGAVTVNDARGAITGWTASAHSTDFVSSPSASVAASAINYTPPPAIFTGIVVVVPTPAIGLDTPKTVQTATATGVNTASWNPLITVLLPAGAQAGTYKATLTHSVL
ncbi:MAG: hypothetical protein ACT4O0_18795 [Pseudonocardia sp.]